MVGIDTRLLIAAALACSISLPALAVAEEPQADTVVVILAPHVSWSEIGPETTPNLWRVVERGAVGNVNARSRVRDAAMPPSPIESALTLSSGAWAVPDPKAPGVYDADESYESGTASDAYRRIMGTAPGDHAILFLGMPATQRANDAESAGAVLGTLGQAIVDAGGATAAVGNSDLSHLSGEPWRIRPAALAAMDASGRVRYGTVSEQLLVRDPSAPFGMRTDLDAFRAAVDTAMEQLGGVAGPRLLVLDPGDTHRAQRQAQVVAFQAAARHRARALATLDAVVGIADELLPPDGILIVAGQRPSFGEGTPEGLGPVVIARAPGASGGAGSVTSPSTQRVGIVTNLDLTATILDAVGVEQPVSVLGRPITVQADPSPATERVAAVDRLDRVAVAVETVKAEVIDTYVVVMIGLIVLATTVLLGWRRLRAQSVRRWTRILQAVVLLLLAAPPASWLMFTLRDPDTAAGVTVAFIMWTAVLWAIGLVVWARAPWSRLPLVGFALGTATLLLLDQWTGTPLSYANFWGYSPLPAARFYGIGNEGAALLFGSAVTGLGMLADQYALRSWMTRATRWGLPLVGIIVVVTAAAPPLGANIGVAVWGTFGFALLWWLANGHRLTWRLWVVIGLLVVALVGGFALIDTFGGGAQTHVGRAIASSERGGASVLLDIIARKAETNLRVLTHTIWAYVLLVILAFLAYMRFRPHGDFADTLAENPRFADVITVALVTGLVAYFTEDSGIVIPAMISLYVGMGIIYLMLARLVRVGEEARR